MMLLLANWFCTMVSPFDLKATSAVSATTPTPMSPKEATRISFKQKLYLQNECFKAQKHNSYFLEWKGESTALQISPLQICFNMWSTLYNFARISIIIMPL